MEVTDPERLIPVPIIAPPMAPFKKFKLVRHPAYALRPSLNALWVKGMIESRVKVLRPNNKIVYQVSFVSLYSII